MKEKITPMLEDWLLVLFWGVGRLSHPTFRNLFEPYEAWEHRRRFHNQLYYLERRGLLLRERQAAGWVYQMTELGRITALGGRDPEARWARDWDGKWRMVLFDLPAGRQSLRQQLLRWLRQNSFGYLQNSVWIHTDPLTEVAEALNDYRDDVESLTIMDAECGAGYSNEAVVRGAWDFDEINKRYAAYLAGFGRQALSLADRRLGFARASHWLRAERIAWQHAFSLDPLLPRSLLPYDYLGVKAWQSRRRVLSALSSSLPKRK